MSALNILIRDHNQILRFLKNDDFSSLKDELMTYLNLESTILYPRLSEIEGLDQSMSEVKKEHHNVQKLLEELDQISHGKKWDETYKRLKKHLLDLFITEEQVFFPEISDKVSIKWLGETAELIEKQKAHLYGSYYLT